MQGDEAHTIQASVCTYKGKKTTAECIFKQYVLNALKQQWLLRKGRVQAFHDSQDRGWLVKH